MNSSAQSCFSHGGESRFSYFPAPLPNACKRKRPLLLRPLKNPRSLPPLQKKIPSRQSPLLLSLRG